MKNKPSACHSWNSTWANGENPAGGQKTEETTLLSQAIASHTHAEASPQKPRKTAFGEIGIAGT